MKGHSIDFQVQVFRDQLYRVGEVWTRGGGGMQLVTLVYRTQLVTLVYRTVQEVQYAPPLAQAITADTEGVRV